MRKHNVVKMCVCACRCIEYQADGSCLFAASQDIMKCYHWEPRRTFCTLMTGWARVADIAVTPTQLVSSLLRLPLASLSHFLALYLQIC